MLKREEAAGRAIYTAAGIPYEVPAEGGAVQVAVELYGADCIVESARAQTDAEPARIGDRTVISIARDLSPRRAHFAIARAVARIEARRRELVGLNIDQLAAYLCAPSIAFRRRIALLGLDIPALADSFCITQTCATMRLVEVGSIDGLIVTPARVYRPSGALAWVDDRTARALARGTPRSVYKVPLQDEPGRVALYRRAG